MQWAEIFAPGRGGAMQKKILLAVDRSIHSKQAINYAAQLVSTVADITFELIHIQPPVSHYLKEAIDRTRLKAVMARQEKQARQLLQEYKEMLLRREVGESRVLLTTLPRQRGVAEDLLDYGQTGRYDALLIGRRGASYLTEVMLGSVTANLIAHSKVTPIWVVDGEVNSPKILVAVDGSEGSLRAVDHLSFILAGNSKAQIQFLHVEPRFGDYCDIDLNEPAAVETAEISLNANRRCIDRFYAQARKILQQAGFSGEQLDIKIVQSMLRTGKAVVEEARKGGYGTVVFGRHGHGRTLFGGSTARYIINKTTDRALWIVP
jgi:nucleotide-binding universal stress UspA family protein